MHSWGYEQPDGDVDGMLKELKEKRIDFGNAPLMYRLYRIKLIDYGYGNWIIRYYLFFKIFSNLKYNQKLIGLLLSSNILKPHHLLMNYTYDP